MILQRPKCIYVDVDGTLLVNGIINMELVRWCNGKHRDGFELILWSARGADHAVSVAVEAGIKSLFSNIITKPGYIVDDKGWWWTRYVKVYLPINF